MPKTLTLEQMQRVKQRLLDLRSELLQEGVTVEETRILLMDAAIWEERHHLTLFRMGRLHEAAASRIAEARLLIEAGGETCVVRNLLQLTLETMLPDKADPLVNEINDLLRIANEQKTKETNEQRAGAAARSAPIS